MKRDNTNATENVRMKELLTLLTFTSLSTVTSFNPILFKVSHSRPATNSRTIETALRLNIDEDDFSTATPSNDKKKKVIVLGGDGFCGWPTSLYLSDQGHDIVIVDNLSRRNIDVELGCDSLTPIQSPEVRAT